MKQVFNANCIKSSNLDLRKVESKMFLTWCNGETSLSGVTRSLGALNLPFIIVTSVKLLAQFYVKLYVTLSYCKCLLIFHVYKSLFQLYLRKVKVNTQVYSIVV